MISSHHISRLIRTALDEDIGSGDITTESLVAPELSGKAGIIAKESLIIAGMEIAEQVFHLLNPSISFSAIYPDGASVASGTVIAQVQGQLISLLLGERTALNFLQRLSGIATHVKSWIDELTGTNVRLVDTRKTIPGLRVLEKYAVRVGGAHNHRMGLFDGVLIKDNHLAVCGGVRKAVERIRDHVSHLIKIEVEVSNMDQVREALEVGTDVIMLDNMSLDQIKAAVDVIRGKAIVEVSGGVTRKNLKALAETGVDIISAGGLTHSARSVDISMNIWTTESPALILTS